MKDLEKKIAQILRKKKDIEAEDAIHLIALYGEEHTWHQKRHAFLQEKLKLIQVWLLLLDKDQEYVIQRHLIDGLSWSNITQEYRKLWPESPKHERTLERIQKKALQKITLFTTKHIDVVGRLVLPNEDDSEV